MPIEVKLSIADHEFNLGALGPHDPPGSFTHHDREDPHIVVVSCNRDDSGGLVYRGNPETSLTVLNNKFRLMTEESGIEAVIEDEGTYSRELMTSRGLGTLALTHYRVK